MCPSSPVWCSLRALITLKSPKFKISRAKNRRFANHAHINVYFTGSRKIRKTCFKGGENIDSRIMDKNYSSLRLARNAKLLIDASQQNRRKWCYNILGVPWHYNYYSLLEFIALPDTNVFIRTPNKQAKSRQTIKMRVILTMPCTALLSHASIGIVIKI